MKLIIIGGLVALIAACSPRSQYKQVQWRNGDDIRALKFLNSIENPIPKNITILNERQEYAIQTYNGIPVEDSFVKKTNHELGQLISVQAAYLDNPLSLKNLPFERFKNIDAARRNIKAKYSFINDEDLQSLKRRITKKPELVWIVTQFPIAGHPVEYQFNVHYRMISQKKLGISWFERPAMIYPQGPKLSSLKELPVRDLGFSPPLSNTHFSILSQNSAASEPFDESETVLHYPPTDSRFDQIQVYYYVQKVLDWCEGKLGLRLQTPLEVQLHVGYPEKTNAAFYYQGKVRLGEGDDVVYSKIPQDPSIVSHEIFHALVDMVGHLPTEGEGGSLNEAFADFFTSQLLGRPELGENSYLQGSFKRTLANTKKWSEKSGGLYGDSLIISGLLWDLSQNLPEEKILKVALKTLSRLSPLSQFTDFARELRSALVEFLSNDELARANKILKLREVPE